MYRKDYLFLTDPEMQKLYSEVEQVAGQEKVTGHDPGETGTGKEHVAKLIHTPLPPRRQTLRGASTAAPCPSPSWNPNCSGTNQAPSPTPSARSWGLFEEAQEGEVFSWMKSGN